MEPLKSPDHGSFTYSAMIGKMTPSSKEELDRMVSELQDHKDVWTGQTIPQQIELIDELIQGFFEISSRWVDAGLDLRGIRDDPNAIGNEWFGGPYATIRYLRSIRRSLNDIQTFGAPRIPGPVKVNPYGQVVAHVFPYDSYDKILFKYRAEVWMDPGVTLDGLSQTQALAYRGTPLSGKVALVLGAGNVSGIPTTDMLYKLFVEKQVVVLKMNPINDYLGPIIVEGFRALINSGFLRVAYGGADVGAYLCNHPGVNEIHITGSDKTFDQIVFGSGIEGLQRKIERQPLLKKRVTGELGNVTPVMIVPGPWSTSDMAYQAELLASWLYDNAGCLCNTPRVIIQHAQWPLRKTLNDAIRIQLKSLQPRKAYYPGSKERHSKFLEAHPEAELYGHPKEGALPLTFIPDINPDSSHEICFTTEAFCPLFSETALQANSVQEFIERAVEFANQKLWGTLAASVLVHPASLRDPKISAAIEKAIGDLEYGAVGVNVPAGFAWMISEAPWGGFPNSNIFDVQSGIGNVHNALMFSCAQKTVVRTPFRTTPKPLSFISQGRLLQNLGSKLTDLAVKPSFWKIPSILATVIKGG